MSVASLLERVGATTAGARLPVVVLDLDSTLFDTAPRQYRILREFAAGRPELSDQVASITLDEMGYEVEAPLVARGIGDSALIDELRAFWHSRFFSSDYCLEDRPAPGAVAFTVRLVELGAVVYYLTGRPAEVMGPGTVTALRRHGFPVLRGRAVLHMKPSQHLDDRRFKSGALSEVESLRGEVVGTVDNEPEHCLTYLQAFPDALHFLFGRVRSPGAPTPHPALHTIETFHV